MKFKILFAPIFPRTYQNLYKFYTKSAGKVKSINLTGCLAADTVSNHKAELIDPIRCADSSNSEDRLVARNIDVKIKKGKKCGQPKPMVPKDPGPPGGKYIIDKCGFYEAPKTNSKKWKTISFILLPIVAVLSTLIMARNKEHLKRQFIPYEYLYIRNKRFPWGDGKHSLFHGSNNFIPEEEETSSDKGQ